MDLRDLRYFSTAAELGHIRAAADRLHLTQPAVTKSIRRLEAELGTTLFEHVGRRVRLTEAGVALRARARLMLQAASDTMREIHAFATGEAGHVRLGASATAVEFLLPEITTALIQAVPDVTLDIAVGMNDVLVSSLKSGQLDLVICPIAQPDAALDMHAFAKDPVVVVASADHPLFLQSRVILADLTRYRWVLPSDSAASRTWLDSVFERHRLPKPAAQIRSASISLTPRLVAGTPLLSFIARRNLGIATVGAMLREVPLHATTMPRDFAVVWRKGAYLSPATLRLRELIDLRGPGIVERLGGVKSVARGQRRKRR